MKINNQKLNAIIIDNEQHCIDELKRGLEKESRVNILGCITDSSKAIEEIVRHRPDLLFLDIDMPILNGFEVLDQLKGTGLKPYVIFVTAHSQFAIKAIKHQAFDFLLKPVDSEEIIKSIDQLLGNPLTAENENNGYYLALEKLMSPKKIRLRISGGFLVVDYTDIIYIEADWNYSKIFTGKDKFETVTMNIGSLEKTLNTSQFVRINRSHIINLDYLKRVKRLTRHCILVKDKEEFQLNIPLHKIRMLERML